MNLKKNELFFKLSVSVLSKLGGIGAAFLFTTTTARILTPDKSGVFFYAITLISIFSVLTRFGFDNYLIREISANFIKKEVPVRLIVRKSVKKVVSVSIITSLSLGIFFAFAMPSLWKEQPQVIVWTSLALLPFSINSLLSSILKGLEKVWLANISLGCLNPSVFLVIVVGLFFCGMDITLIKCSTNYFFAALISALISYVWYNRTIPDGEEMDGKTDFKNYRIATPVAFGLLSVLNSISQFFPTIILGFFCTASDIANYNIANRTAMLVSFLLVAINAVVSPKISKYARNGNFDEIIKICKSATIYCLLPGLIVCIILIVFSGHLILQLFGHGYNGAVFPLRMLVIGQLVVLITGPVSQILLMCNSERVVLYSQVIFTFFVVVLSVVSVKLGGIDGMALSVTFSVSIYHIWLYAYVKRFLILRRVAENIDKI